MSGNRKFAVGILAEKGEVVIKCNGGSMRPHIAPGEAIYLKKVDTNKLRVDDAVFVLIKGNLQVHMISAIGSDKRFQISNAKKFINGWVKPDAIYGLCVKVEDRVRISEEELAKR